MVWWEGIGFGVTQMKFGILNKSSLWASTSSFQLFFFFPASLSLLPVFHLYEMNIISLLEHLVC